MVFLGTGASELEPNPFCNCAVCERAREMDEPLRKRSAFYIDEHSVVDFGPDVLAAAQMYHLKFDKLKNIFITHTDVDHFSINNLYVLKPTKESHFPKRVFMSESAAQWMEQVIRETRDLFYWVDVIGNLISDGRMTIEAIKPYTEVQVDGMKIRTVEGLHYGRNPQEKSINYYFELEDGTKLLYVTDTGLWDEKNYEYLEGVNADILVMEGTFGAKTVSLGCHHLNGEHFLLQTEKMLKHSVINEKTQIYATHIGHSPFSHTEYQDYFKEKSKLDITVALDGMVINR